MPTFKNIVTHNLDYSDVVYMPLSNGYDSNLILNVLYNDTTKSVHAFSVGGIRGRNETKQVIENIRGLDRVKLHSVIVDDKCFDQLADICWRLEGCCYESGVFLQYVMAQEAKKDGANRMICGECSDEVQCKNYHKNLYDFYNGRIDIESNISFRSEPYIITNLMVLKKSSIMLNSFGIIGYYPFNCRKFENISSGLIRKNGFKKAEYKKLCNKEFGRSFLYDVNIQDIVVPQERG